MHLTISGSTVLSNTFVNEISKVLHWQISRGNSNANVEKFHFKDDLTVKKYDEFNITLRTRRNDNENKLIFAHLTLS